MWKEVGAGGGVIIQTMVPQQAKHASWGLDVGVEGCIVVQVVENENALQAEGRACIKAQRHESGCHVAECQKALGLWAM